MSSTYLHIFLLFLLVATAATILFPGRDAPVAASMTAKPTSASPPLTTLSPSAPSSTGCLW